MRKITIDPVTRIEGHAKIDIFLDDDGRVADTQFHVTQIRGFEKFCEGRPFQEMPSITARICGICPVSHLLASAKACDELLAVRVPETGVKLRRMLHHAQFVQSHALSFFHLSSPSTAKGRSAPSRPRASPPRSSAPSATATTTPPCSGPRRSRSRSRPRRTC